MWNVFVRIVSIVCILLLIFRNENLFRLIYMFIGYSTFHSSSSSPFQFNSLAIFIFTYENIFFSAYKRNMTIAWNEPIALAWRQIISYYCWWFGCCCWTKQTRKKTEKNQLKLNHYPNSTKNKNDRWENNTKRKENVESNFWKRKINENAMTKQVNVEQKEKKKKKNETKTTVETFILLVDRQNARCPLSVIPFSRI